MVMAAGGMIIYPKEYLKKASLLCKKYNIHLIVDEVATGFGRTGKMFACEHADINPDFMCLSKGITSGYLPLGITLTTEKIYNAFYDDYTKKKTFYHGHTYTANPISCSAAISSLEIFKNEQTLKKINQIVPLFHSKLEKFKNLSYIGDVRYLGMIGALELVKNKKTKEPFRFNERIGYKIYENGLRRNIILRPLGNIIYLFLPLCVKEKDIEDIIDRMYSVMKM